MASLSSMKKMNAGAELKMEQVLHCLGSWDGCLASEWIVHVLSQGDQADIYSARRKSVINNGALADQLIIKVYRDNSPSDRAAFQREKNGLHILQEHLDGTSFEEWAIRSPRLLYSSDSPLALVMNSVPGQPLHQYLRSHDMCSSEMETIAEVILSALQVYWTQGEIYGDLNLKNILFEPEEMTLAFVDPGMPLEYYRCDKVVSEWSPMSRDLAYLLFSVAVSVKSTLGNPASWVRQQLLVSLLLQRYARSIQSSQRLRLFLEELRQCLNIHLQMLDCTWLPSGVWRRLVRRITQSRINRTLDQLAVPCQGVTL